MNRKESTLSDGQLLDKVGNRLAALRLSRNLTQEQLAEEAGIGVRTVQRMESGAAATRLSGFLRVCRVLGIIDRLDLLLPETTGPSPIEQLKMQRQKRQRASGSRAGSREKTTNWTWGEGS